MFAFALIVPAKSLKRSVLGSGSYIIYACLPLRYGYNIGIILLNKLQAMMLDIK